MTELERRAFSAKEVGTMLGVSEWTIRRMCREHKIRWVPIGKRKMIPAEAIDELLAGDGGAHPWDHRTST